MPTGATKESGIQEPHTHDVLSGRGNFVNYHPGNEHFRSLVQKQKAAYVNCSKQQKGKFSQLIVDQIRSQNPPGRFLKQDSETKLWNDIGEKKALDKTRQALREGAPELLKEIHTPDSNHKAEKASVHEKPDFIPNYEASVPELIPVVNDSPERRVPFSDMNQHSIHNVVSRSEQQQLHSAGITVEDAMDPYRMEATRAHWGQQIPEYNNIEPLDPFSNTIPNQRQIFPEYKRGCHRPSFQRDESLQFESLMGKTGEKTACLEGSSIMSCSIGDITEASLSAVFEDSLRISDIQERLPPLQETNGSKKRTVTDITDFSITSPEMDSYGSSMFEGNNMSSINFEDESSNNPR